MKTVKYTVSVITGQATFIKTEKKKKNPIM